MSFIMLIIILAWFIGWPVLMYAYFKHNNVTVAPSPTAPKRIRESQLRTTPQIEDGKAVVTLRIDGQTYIGTDKDIEHLIRRLKATQMTARTMNEVQALE